MQAPEHVIVVDLASYWSKTTCGEWSGWAQYAQVSPKRSPDRRLEGFASMEKLSLRRAIDFVQKHFLDQDSDKIDDQDHFAECIEMVATLSGEKPSFFGASYRPGRKSLFEKILKACANLPVHAGFFTGPITSPHRQLNIKDAALREILESKMPIESEIFWLTTRHEDADIFRSGKISKTPEWRILGYPECCTRWHYDCLHAREVEIATATYLSDNSAQDVIESIGSDWVRNQSFFLPSAVFRAAIYRSNAVFPFISFLACPKCIGNDGSPASFINTSNSQIGSDIDPLMHERIAAWAAIEKRSLPRRASEARKAIADAAASMQSSSRAKDEFIKQSRYLMRDLGLTSL